jgi:O-antigen/teichoic acid export membrane protein
MLRRLFSPEFADGRFVVPFSAFGYLAYGLYSIGATGLNLRSQTRWLALTVAASALLNLIVNLVAIPRLGFMAAAYSTLLSYGLLAFLTTAASQRYYPVPWDYPRVLGTLSLGLGLAAAGLLGPDAFLWRLACFLALPIVLLATGILTRSDARRLVAWISRAGMRLFSRA